MGKPSPKRVPAAAAEEIETLYRERYRGFTAKHFHEHAVSKHGLRWGYSWTKSYLQERGYLKKAPRRGAHRRKRERKPLPGMMLHQDGSRHRWLPGPPIFMILSAHGFRVVKPSPISSRIGWLKD